MYNLEKGRESEGERGEREGEWMFQLKDPSSDQC